MDISEVKFDQAVKGAPSPSLDAPKLAAKATAKPPSAALAAQTEHSKTPVLDPSDPLSTLPSSPPQIYLNLLILEGSLRAQYLTLTARKRQHQFFLTLLGLWILSFYYLLFQHPREDGKGHGGSVYWVVDMFQKVSFLGGILTAALIWATGQWERGVRWPRRWIGVTNRGLRGMNLKIVILKGPWWRQGLSYIAFLFPCKSFFTSPESSYRFVPDAEKHDDKSARYAYRNPRQPASGMREEDVAPGGDYVKLLLLPKHFSAEFRENWDIYRTEYWFRENERRGLLRKNVKQREIERARAEGGCLWWMGWRGWRKAMGQAGNDLEKMHHHSHNDGRRGSIKDSLRRGKVGTGSEGHSRTTSRSSTPALSIESEDIKRGHRKTKSITLSSTRQARTRRETSSSPSLEPEAATAFTLSTSQAPETRQLRKRASNLENARHEDDQTTGGGTGTGDGEGANCRGSETP